MNSWISVHKEAEEVSVSFDCKTTSYKLQRWSKEPNIFRRYDAHENTILFLFSYLKFQQVCKLKKKTRLIFKFSLLTLHLVARYGCMVMACLTINWGLILLNKNRVVIQATKRPEFTPLLSESAKMRKYMILSIY